MLNYEFWSPELAREETVVVALRRLPDGRQVSVGTGSESLQRQSWRFAATNLAIIKSPTTACICEP